MSKRELSHHSETLARPPLLPRSFLRLAVDVSALLSALRTTTELPQLSRAVPVRSHLFLVALIHDASTDGQHPCGPLPSAGMCLLTVSLGTHGPPVSPSSPEGPRTLPSSRSSLHPALRPSVPLLDALQGASYLAESFDLTRSAAPCLRSYFFPVLSACAAEVSGEPSPAASSRAVCGL